MDSDTNIQEVSEITTPVGSLNQWVAYRFEALPIDKPLHSIYSIMEERIQSTGNKENLESNRDVTLNNEADSSTEKHTLNVKAPSFFPDSHSSNSQTCCINAQHTDQEPDTLRRSQRLKERREKQSGNAPDLPTDGAGGENLINARAATDRVRSDEQCIGRNNESITQTGIENENPVQTTSQILLQWALNKTIAPDNSDISETSNLLAELANTLEIQPTIWRIVNLTQFTIT